MDIHHHIAQRLRELRSARGYSLDALAERSGVSRSNISLIERGESSPTAAVLDKLAIGLGVALASFFDESADGGAAHEGVAGPSPHIRAADQPRWQDPASGYVRRRLSPPAPSPLQLVEGDSCYFDSTMGHVIVSAGPDDAKILVFEPETAA